MVHVPETKRNKLNRADGFEPLMTLYMTDGTTADEIRRAAATKQIVAVKLYPGKWTKILSNWLVSLRLTDGIECY